MGNRNLKETLTSLGGQSNEVFLRTKGKEERIIVRICKSAERANYIEALATTFAQDGFFPQLLSREGNNLFFAYVGGRECRKEDAQDVALSVGRICGIINSSDISCSTPPEPDFRFCLGRIVQNGLIKESEGRKITYNYYRLKNALQPRLCLDAHDVYPLNFKVDGDKVYFVDTDAIKHRFRGRGIAKAFSRWFVTEEHRDKFWKGYTSFASKDFWTPEYEKFISLDFTVGTLSYRIYRNEQFNPKDVKTLRSFLSS